MKTPQENAKNQRRQAFTNSGMHGKKHCGAKFIDNRPGGAIQQETVVGDATGTQSTTVDSSISTDLKPAAHRSVASAPMQRLIISVGGRTLSEDTTRDVGWITASTLQVALDHGGQGQDIIEYAELNGYSKIKADENIYFVGHGSKGKIGTRDPAELARATGLILPEDYQGSIISLNCSSGATKDEASEDSGVDAFADTIKLDGVVVAGPQGVSLHHPAIPGKVRAIKEGHYRPAVLSKILAMQSPIDEAWRTARDQVVQSNAYISAAPAEQIKMLAGASIELSAKFYVDLVDWADKEGHLYPADEPHLAVKYTSE
ncbi:hypothetical protein [Teredinibacter turnerae]|uniref:hypothetical protein n=1 Tax=Teredinibacter turnerae TaxID=2426 RepID=UPI00041C62F0|nr:hypothetical protein [Teredinibacter turnerae]